MTHDCLLNNYELIHIRTTLKCDVLVCMVTRDNQVLIPRGDFVILIINVIEKKYTLVYI